MKNMIIASTSTIHGSGYLEYLLKELIPFFNSTEEIPQQKEKVTIDNYLFTILEVSNTKIEIVSLSILKDD